MIRWSGCSWVTKLLFGLIVFCLISIQLCAEIRQLPYCENATNEGEVESQSLIYISTLNGKLTALDAAQNGKQVWTFDAKSEPFLSSSIHRRDLNNHGQWVKLIPSLRGKLYKFDGENLETIPVSVDQLLQSSFRYSDDLVISGGKELVTYGLSSLSGKLLYECKKSKCTNATSGDTFVKEDVLVVRRLQNTIRAADPRTGVERWNFSVGHHDLTLIPSEKSDCNGKAVKEKILNLDYDIRAIISEGIVAAYSKSNVKLWEYKFESPVVSIWKEDAGFHDDIKAKLKEVNLFDSSQWASEFSESPGLYVGMHERQLYIQENPSFSKAVAVSSLNTETVKFPWRPYPAGISEETDLSIDRNEVSTATALSVLYNSGYINGNGFYLYSKEQMQIDEGNQCNGSNPSPTFNENNNLLESSSEEFHDAEDDTPVQVIIVSLWYWWKEVVIISLTTAVIMNFVLTQRFLNAAANPQDAIPAPLIVERHIVDAKVDKKVDDVENNFVSRYLNDYEPLTCLGQGGYGVVFEARNKLDDCKYAIKRIELSNSQNSRERVMREVKALAKLDHQNIVRYFSAWIECPPNGWQEEYDHQLPVHSNELLSDFEETSNIQSVHIDVPASNSSSDIDSACEAYELNRRKEDDDDSFIQFEASVDNDCTASSKIHHNQDTMSCSINLSTSGEQNRKNIVKNESGHDLDGDSVIFEESVKNELARRKSEMSLDFRTRRRSSKSSNTKMFLYIQMQLCQKLSLKDWLKSEDTPRENVRIIHIFEQIVDAVHYVHLQGLMHRDLKPSNIFFSFDEKIKIGDFGLVTAMTEGCNGIHTPSDSNGDIFNKVHTARVGTHLYMSPEQINGQNYNYKVDIYSLGIILFELLIPFQTEMERVNTLTKLRNSIFPENFSQKYPNEYRLLKMMLDKVPENRPTTIGIKDRPPLNALANSSKFDEQYHFDLPQLSRQSSNKSSSGSGSWEHIIC